MEFQSESCHRSADINNDVILILTKTLKFFENWPIFEDGVGLESEEQEMKIFFKLKTR